MAIVASSAAEHRPRRQEEQTWTQANPWTGRDTARKVADLTQEADVAGALPGDLNGS